jgi:hypothetical protein
LDIIRIHKKVVDLIKVVVAIMQEEEEVIVTNEVARIENVQK